MSQKDEFELVIEEKPCDVCNEIFYGEKDLRAHRNEQHLTAVGYQQRIILLKIHINRTLLIFANSHTNVLKLAAPTVM
jgi:hypothetical protein